MNIIIVGAGEIGRYLAGSLSQDAHDIVVIERDEGLAEELNEQLDVRVMAGHGAVASILSEANIGECDLLFAMTSADMTNLVVSRVAKELGAKKVICRISPRLRDEGWLFDYRTAFGIDYVFSPERLVAIELSKFILHPDALMVEEIARGKIEVQQVEVAAGCALAGKSLREIAMPVGVRIGAIKRGDKSIIPGADEKIQAGDLATVFGETRKIGEVIMELSCSQKGEGKGTSLVIFGGGEYGAQLAQMLSATDVRVRVMEEKLERCEELSRRLNDVVILNVDATSLAELREERVGDADFFVATTSRDEDNVMSCLQAHNLGTEHCLTLLHRADYANAISSSEELFGVLAAVSPREATRRELVRFITSDRYHIYRELDAGKIIEMPVTAKVKLAGEKIGDIKWPVGCVLVALLRGSKGKVPTVDDELTVGDFIYAFVSAEAEKAFLKMI